MLKNKKYMLVYAAIAVLVGFSFANDGKDSSNIKKLGTYKSLKNVYLELDNKLSDSLMLSYSISPLDGSNGKFGWFLIKASKLIELSKYKIPIIEDAKYNISLSQLVNNSNGSFKEQYVEYQFKIKDNSKLNSNINDQYDELRGVDELHRISKNRLSKLTNKVNLRKSYIDYEVVTTGSLTTYTVNSDDKFTVLYDSVNCNIEGEENSLSYHLAFNDIMLYNLLDLIPIDKNLSVYTIQYNDLLSEFRVNLRGDDKMILMVYVIKYRDSKFYVKKL